MRLFLGQLDVRQELVMLHLAVQVSEVGLGGVGLGDVGVVQGVLAESLQELFMDVLVHDQPGRSHTVLPHIVHAAPEHLTHCIGHFGVLVDDHTRLASQFYGNLFDVLESTFTNDCLACTVTTCERDHFEGMMLDNGPADPVISSDDVDHSLGQLDLLQEGG